MIMADSEEEAGSGGEERYDALRLDSPSQHEDSHIEEEAKDETELELERLVFGDGATFATGIRTFSADQSYLHADATNGENELAALGDADLFFMDDALPQGLQPETTNEKSTLQRQAVWHDSDDDRTQISLMSAPRLRKLRQFEGEDMITGREYTRRLRQHYEMLHPRPKWATHEGSHARPRKRRRLSDNDEVSSDESMSGMSVDGDEEEDLSSQPLSALLRSGTSLTAKATKREHRPRLKPEVIPIERMKDIGPTQPSVITSISMHPDLPLIISSGPSSTVYLHQLNPHPTPPDPPNPLLTSLHLTQTPLHTSVFSSSSQPQIFLSGRRRYFHVWDLSSGSIRKVSRVYGQQHTQRTFETLKPSPCGRYVALMGSTKKSGGVVNILDAESHQWITSARLESRKGLADFAWWANGNGLVVAGKGGEVAEWSMETRAVVTRWNDEGAVGTTCIALGGSLVGVAKKADTLPCGPDRWIAIGSTSGIVNIYDRLSWTERPSRLPDANPKPTKVFEHLTTPVSHLVFSKCGQLMVMASRWKRDALRLVHLPTCTVYRNWPTNKTPLGRISAVALGEYAALEEDADSKRMILCVGNEAGVLRGWELGS
ncbi:hypothetical protein MRB53_038522 [Persea americana]|nr:hypothetical protein MRB53_038522 [Persea americana]